MSAAPRENPCDAPKRVLLLMRAETYRAHDFLSAGRTAGTKIVVATDSDDDVIPLASGQTVSLPFHDPVRAVQIVQEFVRSYRIDGIHAVDEEAVVVASAVATALNLSTNSTDAATLTCNKAHMRQRLFKANVRSPVFAFVFGPGDLRAAANDVGFPCVIKPTFLSASQGVIRVDQECDLRTAYHRIQRIIGDRRHSPLHPGDPPIVVEMFVDGREFALEGLLRGGRLQTLALFDKPDPLDGPYFEETLYVTPSREPKQVQMEIERTAAHGARALGLREGPVHAEVRVNASGVWIIEMAARTIGGLCSRAVRLATGMTLEEVVIRSAAQMPIPTLERGEPASGVMMLPIPKRGMLRQVGGIEDAKAIADIEDVQITIPIGQKIVPPPDGRRYLGFVFSRAPKAERVEAALRQAHAALHFEIADTTTGEA